MIFLHRILPAQDMTVQVTPMQDIGEITIDLRRRVVPIRGKKVEKRISNNDSTTTLGYCRKLKIRTKIRTESSPPIYGLDKQIQGAVRIKSI